MKAIWNNQVIALSDETLVVEGNHYFPRASIVEACYQPSDHSSYCPWKGTASYLDVVVDGQTNPQAAWFYPETKPEADHIRGYVAFWNGVRVEA